MVQLHKHAIEDFDHRYMNCEGGTTFPLFLIPLFLEMQRKLASNMRSGLCHTRHNALDFFHDNDLGTNLGRSPGNSVLDSEKSSNFCGACVGAAENENVPAAQKELLMALEIRHWDVSLSRNDA